jgi:hypothetical protein
MARQSLLFAGLAREMERRRMASLIYMWGVPLPLKLALKVVTSSGAASVL